MLAWLAAQAASGKDAAHIKWVDFERKIRKSPATT
jgi:hypothetical protein